jgi:hypothetical protein
MLLIVIFLTVATCAQEPRVSWFDEFLGVKINPAYNQSLSDTATIQLAPDSGGNGGLAMLSVVGYASGVARLRLGEDPVTGGIHALNFSARKNLAYQSRAFINTDTDIAATIGFIGFRDPDNVIALIWGVPGANWLFEVVNDGRRILVDTGFRHTPGRWFTVKITTEWAEIPTARVYINEKLAAEVSGDYVPRGGLSPEYQLWNQPSGEAYSQPTMWIDYLSVSQDR